MLPVVWNGIIQHIRSCSAGDALNMIVRPMVLVTHNHMFERKLSLRKEETLIAPVEATNAILSNFRRTNT